MRRRIRLDLGQSVPSKETQEKLDRQRERWRARNRSKAEDENPFVAPILPVSDKYGDEHETYEELKRRLNNLEFGNFPGYFNYRNKAATNVKEASRDVDHDDDDEKKDDARSASQKEETQIGAQNSDGSEGHKKSTLECGLEDERLKFFRKEWFEGKEALDIGCNRGHITYAIAKLFAPKFILGIDIDPKIVHSALKDLRSLIGYCPSATRLINRYSKRAVKQLKIAESNESATDQDEGGGLVNKKDAAHTESSHDEGASHKRQKLDATLPMEADLSSIDQDQLSAEGSSRDGFVGDEAELSSGCFPSNIYFVEHNYVPARDELASEQQACFDTIVCLSVTKWIHLNYRDAGLKRFFKRIYNHLKPGGLFVLEVQPFDNYGRRKKMSDRLRANYYTIKFKPTQFDEYLLGKEVGFKRILASTTTEHQCAGFKRPLKVFEK